MSGYFTRDYNKILKVRAAVNERLDSEFHILLSDK